MPTSAVNDALREEMCGIDSYPITVSSKHVERKERGDPLLPKPTKNPKPNKNEDHDIERSDMLCSDIRNGCKNSEKTSWMTEFLNAETHTPVLLMNHL